MTVIDLRKVRDPDEFVLRLSGDFHSVEASDISRLIASFADAYRELGKQVQWDDFEVHVVGFEAGSFKTVFRRIDSEIRSLFTDVPRQVVVTVLAALLLNFLRDPGFELTEFQDHVVFQRGDEQYIFDRADFEAAESLEQPEKVGKPLARFFRRLFDMPDVIGLSVEDRNENLPYPYIYVPRVDFARVAEQAELEEDRREERVIREERIPIQIVKAVFNDPTRKWDFIIAGRKESCRITDKDFYRDTLARKYVFGRGDVLLVDLVVFQRLDAEHGVWMNEAFEVEKVHELVPGGS
ncbi:hypothetical protein [Pontivivens insulae]|uniref:Uncharacterized protein n=1 Tax=Pontivivens insulae TaxID=1639689 RepID=A0A2R8AAT5_9RHOB|nr:hypothetical protein [Pontivivens insulae]RED13234.1 hypothetical protein DFR53_2370 [Pontivivens insulae]SPF29326.1 hypothetical protein POI8812_01634 [Pontivivens insulae]